ncbi:MAG: carbohydrate ABC transporter permease [Nitrososphaerota archaeon]
MIKRALSTLTVYTVSILVLIWIVFPIYWMITVSFKTGDKLFNPEYIVMSPSIESYIAVVTQDYFRVMYFWRQLLNSIYVASLTVAFTLIISIFVGYAMARLRFRGKTAVSTLTLTTYVFPYAFLSIPYFILMTSMGLLNTHISVVIAQVIFVSPYAIWLLWEYSRSIPVEVDESAIIDGASPAVIFYRIFLPLSLPALAAIGAYAFLFSWNQYLYPFMLLSSETELTLPVAMGFFLVSDEAPWNIFMATATLYSIPPIIFYYLFKRYLIAGLVAGAMKR